MNKLKSLRNQLGLVTLEYAVLSLLVLAFGISMFGAVKDAYYDELIAAHNIVASEAIMLANQIIVDGCDWRKSDDEGYGRGGRTDVGCQSKLSNLSNSMTFGRVINNAEFRDGHKID